MRCWLSALVLIVVATTESGCAILPHEQTGDATFHLGWDRVRGAAKDAALDPWVWAPVAGAAVLQIDHWDQRTSHWAREQTPMFNSTDGAKTWSDRLLTTSLLIGAAAVVTIPPGDEPVGSLFERHKGTAVELSAMGAAAAVTAGLKTATQRERPNGENHASFPSGHASGAAVAGRLATIDLESVDMDARMRRALDVGIDTTTLACGWARVEAGAHYPSDSLAGIALGNFFATFFTRAFLNPESPNSFSLASTGDGAMLRWQVVF